MYYYGQNTPYGQQGGYPYSNQQGNTSSGHGNYFVIFLVLFILLVIIGCGWSGGNNNGLCGGC